MRLFLFKDNFYNKDIIDDSIIDDIIISAW